MDTRTSCSRLIAISFAILPATLFAEESSQLRLGLGVGFGHDVFVETDRLVYAVPLVFYRNGNFYADGTRAGYHFYQDGGFQAAVQLQLRQEGFDPDDSEALRDFQDHDTAVEAGILLSYRWSLGETSFFGGFDVSSTYGGDVMTLKHTYPIHYDGISLEPYIAATRRDRQFAVYYYGVKPEEATVQFPQFNTDDDTSYELGIDVDFPVGKRWGLVGSLAYEKFHSSIFESPIVEDDSSFKGMIGVTYQF